MYRRAFGVTLLVFALGGATAHAQQVRIVSDEETSVRLDSGRDRAGTDSEYVLTSEVVGPGLRQSFLPSIPPQVVDPYLMAQERRSSGKKKVLWGSVMVSGAVVVGLIALENCPTTTFTVTSCEATWVLGAALAIPAGLGVVAWGAIQWFQAAGEISRIEAEATGRRTSTALALPVGISPHRAVAAELFVGREGPRRTVAGLRWTW